MMVSTSLRVLGSLVTARRFIQGLLTHYELHDDFSVSLNTKNAVTTMPNLFSEQRPTSFFIILRTIANIYAPRHTGPDMIRYSYACCCHIKTGTQGIILVRVSYHF